MKRTHPSLNTPQQVQLGIGAIGALAYFAHTLTEVQIGRLILTLIAIGLFPATFLLARGLGTENRAAQEPIAVMLVASLAFTMPVASLPGPRGPGFISSALGILTVHVLWGALRYEVRDAGSAGFVRNLRWGLGWGAALAATFSLIALVIIGIAATAGSRGFRAIPFVIGSYWVGGLLGGLLVGVLRPFNGWPLTRMFIGVLAAFCAYGAVAIAVGLSGDPEFIDSTLRDQLTFAVIAGLFVGPPAALGTSDW